MSTLNYNNILTPVHTEKATINVESLSKYSFFVSKFATKKIIKALVEDLFKVSVTSVNVLNVKGKVKVFKGKKGFRSSLRKAIVTVAAGNIIDYQNFNY